MSEVRERLYERLMDAEERVAARCYARGVNHDEVLEALHASELDPSPAERQEDMYLASLGAFVQSLGGAVEVRAVFGEEAVTVLRLASGSS